MTTVTDLAPASAAPHRTIDTTGAPGPVVVVHSLTTLTGVCLNRDMMGLPKSVAIGGSERMRVSSQALIRAARTWIRTHGTPGSDAASSRLLPQQTAQRLELRGIDPADALPAAALVVTAAGLSIDPAEPDKTRVMAYVPTTAPEVLADIVLHYWDNIKEQRQAMEDLITTAVAAASGGKGRGRRSKTAKDEESSAAPAARPADSLPAAMVTAARDAYAPGLTLEIALFGRMLAELPDGRVTSAVSVAHGMSVDPMDLLTDEYTAGDDWQDGGTFGAGMIGEQYLCSGTLYRCAHLDRNALRRNLAASGADPATVEVSAQRAEQLFTTAITYALPNARSSRTGSAAWPTLAIAATTDAPLTAAAAFETPIAPPAGEQAAARLAAYLGAAGLRGGTARWLSPTGAPAPQLPDTLTLETY